MRDLQGDAPPGYHFLAHQRVPGKAETPDDSRGIGLSSGALCTEGGPWFGATAGLPAEGTQDSASFRCLRSFSLRQRVIHNLHQQLQP